MICEAGLKTCECERLFRILTFRLWIPGGWPGTGCRRLQLNRKRKQANTLKYINQLQILLMLGLQYNIYLNLLNLFRYLLFPLHPSDSGQQNTGMHFNGNEASGKMKINWVKNSSQQFGNLIYGKCKSYYYNKFQYLTES